MKILVEDRGSYIHVKLKEQRLDIFSASMLKEVLFKLIQRRMNENIVLEISHCSYCDTSGLSAMNILHQMCENSMGTFILTGIQANIEKLIKICMLHRVWTIAKDMDEAEDMMKRRRKFRFNCA